MAKDKLTDYDATAANNTDVGGISVDEGMLPSNVNNAIREVMSHLKDFAAGTEAVDAIEVTGDLTVDTDTLKVDSTNNRVGIGTTSPAALIHGMSGDLFLTANSTAANSGQGVYFQSTTNGWATSAAHAAIFGKRVDGSNGYLRFDTRSGGTTAERMRIDSSGNVGIGTTSPTGNPTTTLHINGTTNAGIHITDSASGATNSDGVYLSMDSPNLYIQNKENGFTAFETNGLERMRLNSGGQLLINHTDNRLNGAVESKAGSGVLQRAYTAEITSSNGAQVCYWAEADITSGTAYFGYFRYNNSNVGGIFGTSSSTSFTTSSDYRLKENVEAMTGAITRVKSLKPKRFSWIIDDLDGANVDGFLAHEAAAVVPESVVGAHNEVDGNGDPVYQSIDQSKLVPLLTAALQEAITKIEALETENATQATTIADFETRIAALESA